MAKKRRNGRHEAFGREYRGPGDGARAAKAAGYRGGEASLRVTASRLLQRDAIRDAIRARGVPLPGDGPPPSREGAAEDPIHWLHGVATGRIPATRVQLDAMRASALERRRAEPDTSGDERMARLRDATATAIRGIHERESTPSGLAGILNAIRCRVRRDDMRAVLDVAIASLRAMGGDG